MERNWLRDFFPEQLEQAGFNSRIVSFGCNSDIFFSKSVTNIDDVAEMLLDYIDVNRQTSQEYERPILFIAHSLGVIVSKKV